MALLGLDPVELVAIAAIVLGGSLIFRANFAPALMATRSDDASSDVVRLGASELLSESAAIQALTGLAAAVLGILALAGFSALVLVLVAFLTLGSGLLVNSAAFGDWSCRCSDGPFESGRQTTFWTASVFSSALTRAGL